MKIKIDQSSKIEYTSKNTVIAYANTKQKSILILAKDKRKLKEIFRTAGKPHIFVYKTFALLIYLLIKNDLQHIDSIIIDKEYEGQEDLIKNFLIQIIRKEGRFFEKEKIAFAKVGRYHNCHIRAIAVFRKNTKADIIVKTDDLLKYIL